MYRSFLLRVWYEDGQNPGDQNPGDQNTAAQTGPHWQAEVQQIQSGESWTFKRRRDLLAFVQQLTHEAHEESNDQD